MNSAGTYHIADEPRPSTLARLAVNPFWPLLGVMFGGAWLSWPWFVFNAYAVGSPTRRRELAAAAGGFVGGAGLLYLLLSLIGGEVVPQRGLPYLLTILVLWKLGISYWLYVLQARTFELYTYFGGTVRNGIVVLIAAFLLEVRMMAPLREKFTFLYILLS